MKFNIRIQNRVAEVLATGGELPLLVCDNTDNTVTFTFDAEWSGYAEKTARFVYREDFGHGALVYTDASFTGDTVAVPLLHNVREVWIGVIAGSVVTTSAARLSCLASVYGFSASPVAGSAIETETKHVALALAGGDQTVSASAGKLMSAVVIEKPATLLPQNIRKGVTVAGVVGTYEGDSDSDTDTDTVTVGAPSIVLSGTLLTVTPGTGLAPESYEIYLDGALIHKIPSQRVSLTSNLEDLSVGTHTVYAIACIDSRSLTSGRSNVIFYTVAAPSDTTLGVPTVEIVGDVLKITPGTGDVESYEILVGGESAYTTSASVTEIDLSSILSYLDAGIYSVSVIAWNDSVGSHSEATDPINYTYSGSANTYTLTVTSTGDKLFRYAKNSNIIDLSDGFYEEEWSDMLTVSGLTFSDEILVQMSDTDYTVEIVSAIGCKVTGYNDGGMHGTYFTVTKFTQNAILQLNVVIRPV